MSDNKFKNKYRIPSARAVWHDYDGGTYFITICTHKRNHYFGEIVDNGANGNSMMLSEIGKMADECIAKMETLHDDIIVPLWVVMTNHIHLIVIVKPPIVETPYYDVSTDEPTDSRTELKNEKVQEIANSCGRLSHVISRFKTAVTKLARENDIHFVWQTRFHDRIVRDTDELNRISDYIENNVARWADDTLNDEKNPNCRNDNCRDAIL